MASRSILVADESLPVRTVLTDILVKLGQAPDTIHTASSEKEALAVFEKHHPEVVFTELWFQERDALRMLMTMLNTDPRLKIVLVTAEDRAAPEAREAIRMGVFEYIDKPLRMEKIRAVIGAIMVEEGGVERMR